MVRRRLHSGGVGHPLDKLPVGKGPWRYVSPDEGGARRVRLDDGTGAFEDNRGNYWKWGRVNNSAGICEHWDVVAPSGRHTNIKPDGTHHHGRAPEEFFR